MSKRNLLIARAEQLCFDAGMRNIDADHEEFESRWVLGITAQLRKETRCGIKESAEAARIGFDRAIEKLQLVKDIAQNRGDYFPPIL